MSLNAGMSGQWKKKLDVAKIREAAKYLTGTHDFMAFAETAG